MYSEITVKTLDDLLPIIESMLQTIPIEITLKRNSNVIDVRLIRIDEPERDGII